MSRDSFTQRILQITSVIADLPIEVELADILNRLFPADCNLFKEIESDCHEAISDGWMCKYEGGGIRYGRVIKPEADNHQFSVDVVKMVNLAGPHHRHPNGEIDMIMPITDTTQFDGHGAGWLVYEPGSAHCPTVTGGEALILYLLPGGKIEFTNNQNT